ncbi:MAG: hypothetical protein Q7T82_10890 [Armatimonadota bacterium]|nr:hypothetical protein [Armatimonadota bacterium]
MSYIAKTRRFIILTLALASVAGAALSAADVSSTDPDPREKTNTIEFYGGTAYNFRTSLKVEQSGQPDLSFDAKYRTSAFESPIYYGWRFGMWRGDKATEIEWIHHKLYLVNRPAEIQNFSISHGFNMFMLNKAREKNGIIYRIGGGVVITHPESAIRGQKFPEDNGIFNKGYYLSGPAVQVAIGKRFDISGHFFGSLEGKLTAAYARVNVADGHANVTNVATHFLFGIGYKY